MTPPQLDLENPIEVSLIKLMQAESAPPPLTFPEVSHGLPVRGLLLSAVAHQLVVVAILLLSFTLTRTYLPASRAFNGTIKLSDAKGVIYLPVLGGGSEGSGVVPGACSLIIPGVGQLINGEGDKALGVFAVFVVTGAAFLTGLPLIGGIFGIAHLATHVYAAGDAYLQGRKKR